MAAKLHIILYINERIVQKVKIMTLFMKYQYKKNIVTLQRET